MSRLAPRPVRRTVLALWIVSLLLAAGAAWLTRRTMNPDGVSYLDLADAWRAGHWGAALSDYWSPLYSWLLAGWLALVRPSAAHEYPAVHALNLALFVLALLAFAYLLEALFALAARRAQEAWPPLRAHALRILAYGAFAWTALDLISVGGVTPDLLTAALSLVAAGLLVRIRLGDGRRTRQALLLGLVLGIGYLAKAVMLPAGLLFLAVLPLAAGRPRARLLAPAVAAFAVVVIPFAVALSIHAGAPTTGATAGLNRAWFVEAVPFPIWEGGGGHGSAAHPPARLARAPATYAFDTHLRGSSPLWADPAWWYAGVRHRLAPAAQWRALRRNARSDLEVATSVAGLVLLATLVLTRLLSGSGGRGWRDQLPVLIPAAAIVLLYVPLTTTPRYIGAAVAMAAACGVAALRPPRRGRAVVVLPALIAVAGALLFIEAVAPLRSLAADAIAGRPAAGTAWTEARALEQAGVGRGERVATLGENLGTTYGVSSMRAPWARLAGVTVVADITEPARFFALGPSARRALEQRLTAHGARWVVSEIAPAAAEAARWRPLGQTGAWLLPLTRG